MGILRIDMRTKPKELIRAFLSSCSAQRPAWIKAQGSAITRRAAGTGCALPFLLVAPHGERSWVLHPEVRSRQRIKRADAFVAAAHNSMTSMAFATIHHPFFLAMLKSKLKWQVWGCRRLGSVCLGMCLEAV